MNTQNSPRADVTVEDLAKQIENLREDLRKLSVTAAEGVADGINSAGKQIVKSSRDAKATVVDAVVENPLTAIGIAAGLGYLFGMFTRR